MINDMINLTRSYTTLSRTTILVNNIVHFLGCNYLCLKVFGRTYNNGVYMYLDCATSARAEVPWVPLVDSAFGRRSVGRRPIPKHSAARTEKKTLVSEGTAEE